MIGKRLSRQLLCAHLLLAACVTLPASNDSVIFGEWPREPDGYRDALKRWTRHATARKDVDTVIDAFVTLKSNEWRASYAREHAKRLRLNGSAAAEFSKEQ